MLKKLVLTLTAIALVAALTTPLYAATKDVVYASESTVKSLDPHDTTDTYSGAIEKAICQGLMGFDRELKIKPLLAESYSFNDEATEFTFKLRRGIKFQDGAPFDARAVKTNIDRLMTGKYKRSSLMKPVKELKIIDDYTVQFILKEPFGAFVNAVAHPGALMVSPKALAEMGDDIKRHPVGTGPFLFDSWVPGSRLTVKKNPDYWNGEVKVDSITFKSVPESGARLAMLRAGQAQYIYPMPAELRRVAEMDKKIEIISVPSIIERYLLLNNKFKPMADQRVRQAINYALDKEAIIKIAFGGAAVEASSIIPANLQFYSDQGTWPHDLDKAKALMKEAGYEKGFRVTFYTPNASNRLRATEMVKQQLEKIGITGDLQSMDVASFYNMLESFTPETVGEKPFIAFGGWSASTGDADWGIRPLLTEEAFPPSGLTSNFGFFFDEKLEDLVQKGLSSADQQVRAAAYTELQKDVWPKCPWGYLFVDTLLAARATNLKGIYPLPDGGFSVEKAEIVE